jgi:hypothetical protein
MGQVGTKGSTPKRPRSSASQTGADKRLAAQRVMAAANGQRAAQRKKRFYITLAPIMAVVVVVAVLLATKLGSASGSPASGAAMTAANPTVVAEATGVPVSTLNAVGAGSVTTPPTAISGAPLTANGLPRILYVGAEYCPYCAAERWAVVTALSRFGSFSNLGATTSSPSDVFPSTATFSFHGASYKSSYLSFTGVEIQSNQVVNGGFAPLDTLSASDQALMNKYDTGGGIPFIDIGGKYMISGSSFSPAVLQGKTSAQIAAALADPTSSIAKAIDGTANVITAAISKITNSQPSSVSNAPGVLAAASKLPA